jgi:hypothetical protein
VRSNSLKGRPAADQRSVAHHIREGAADILPFPGKLTAFGSTTSTFLSWVPVTVQTLLAQLVWEPVSPAGQHKDFYNGTARPQ